MPGIAIMLFLGILAIISCNKTNSNTLTNESVSVSNQTVKSKGKVYFDLFDTVSYIYSYRGDSEEEFIENTDLAYYTLLKYHNFSIFIMNMKE